MTFNKTNNKITQETEVTFDEASKIVWVICRKYNGAYTEENKYNITSPIDIGAFTSRLIEFLENKITDSVISDALIRMIYLKFSKCTNHPRVIFNETSDILMKKADSIPDLFGIAGMFEVLSSENINNYSDEFVNMFIRKSENIDLPFGGTDWRLRVTIETGDAIFD